MCMLYVCACVSGDDHLPMPLPVAEWHSIPKDFTDHCQWGEFVVYSNDVSVLHSAVVQQLMRIVWFCLLVGD